MTTLTDEERTCPVCKSLENIIATEKYNRWQKVWYLELKCAKCGSRWHSSFYNENKESLFNKLFKAIFGGNNVS